MDQRTKSAGDGLASGSASQTGPDEAAVERPFLTFTDDEQYQAIRAWSIDRLMAAVDQDLCSLEEEAEHVGCFAGTVRHSAKTGEQADMLSAAWALTELSLALCRRVVALSGYFDALVTRAERGLPQASEHEEPQHG